MDAAAITVVATDDEVDELDDRFSFSSRVKLNCVNELVEHDDSEDDDDVQDEDELDEHKLDEHESESKEDNIFFLLLIFKKSNI